MNKKYTNEKNILILISLLKEHNIRKVIASPGAMNISFVNSIQNDDFFQIYSCVDERSAAYMACGLAQESGEPVILTCTGATASRNYVPGLTEAFYNNLPVLAITSAQHLGKIGHNFPQVVDRTTQMNDLVKLSVQLPSVYSEEDEWACITSVNKALLELRHNGCGPVHINLVTYCSPNYNVSNLPKIRKINRLCLNEEFPKINNKKIGIYIGNHKTINEELQNEIDIFCETYNAVVLCDMTSNYYGKYGVKANIICDQDNYISPVNNFDLIIHIGNISGAYMKLNTSEVFRVNIDGALRDTFYRLTNIFEMDELSFFKKYNSMSKNTINISFYNEWNLAIQQISEKINYDSIPLTNIWIAKNIYDMIPEYSKLHLGILNSLRSWNYQIGRKKIYSFCNTGGFGIDGCLSTAVGASLNNKNEKIFCILGDLAFFYDMNALGNRSISNNLRIIVINNGCGTEFHNYNHYAKVAKENVGKYIAADGHFGNKSNDLIKNYATSLGFNYISANSKEEFLRNVDSFFEDSDKSIVFEIFTNSDDESKALKTMRNLCVSKTYILKEKSKNILPKKVKNCVKKVLKK